MVKIQIGTEDVSIPHAAGFPAGSVQIVEAGFAAALVDRGHATIIEDVEVEKTKPKTRK